MKKLTFDSGHWTETAVPTLKMIAKYRALIFWVLWISKEVPLLNSFHLPFSLSSCAPPSLSKVVLFLKWNFLLNWWERALSLSCTQAWMIKSKDTKNSNDSTLASSLRSMWFILCFPQRSFLMSYIWLLCILLCETAYWFLLWLSSSTHLPSVKGDI